MAVSVRVKYQIKIKGYSLRNVGPIGISAQAKTESAVMKQSASESTHPPCRLRAS